MYLSQMKGFLPDIGFGLMGRAEGQSWRKTENGKSNNSKRRFSIEAILILVIAAICSGGGGCSGIAMLSRSMIGFCRLQVAAKTYKVHESEYRRYRVSDEVKSVSAVTDGQASDTKSVQALNLVSSRSTGLKTSLTGECFHRRIEKAADTLNDQTSE